MSENEQLQADAVNRAKEMYRRSQSYSLNGFPSGYNGSMSSAGKAQSAARQPRQEQKSTQADERQSVQNTPNTPEPPTVQNIQDEPAENESEAVGGCGEKAGETSVGETASGDFLDSLMRDKERALIILLIALLSEEKASASLLLALVYLIM